MTTYNDDGKTSLSRPPDLEGTEEIRPWAYWYAHREYWTERGEC